MANKKYSSKQYDWRSNISKRGFPYRGDLRTNKKYLEDRRKLFEENGNGWWWFVPNKIHYPISKRVKRIKKMPKSMEKKQIVSKLGL
tara:strand:+ start:186 stop:446 length:261 start_codon:yes stop_codon:yes gene_type:complete